jgi:hypothetical protein
MARRLRGLDLVLRPAMEVGTLVVGHRHFPPRLKRSPNALLPPRFRPKLLTNLG